MAADIRDLLNAFQEEIDDHRSTFDENDIRDFTDAFIKEVKESGSDDAFCDQTFNNYLSDLFQAGTETTSTTINWAILCCGHYPIHQERIAQEIDDVIGDSTPTMKQCERMPYTCAFIHEIMRHRTLVPLSVMHQTNEDSTLLGYHIPKNTTICPNLWSVHFDPDYFKDPEKFMPERFLDSGGRFVPSSHVIPFSMGPRVCLGEQLARMEIFIFLTNIIRKFRIVRDPTRRLPPFEDGILGLATYQPPDFEVIFEKRRP